ncbi:flagellar basal body P-ring formation chaperone FlgA [Thermodesulfatator atlanticus]|uniref:flagellar basal body P-ring formation chaperone FlgA n=1 Tax=Thermodesulfatator atlanticus TaxID=501497 RepID=UPI0003B781C4|nr:flagellar basal body P-ring formation chaperone FlgA [Thermodesulfatator atlanticus]
MKKAASIVIFCVILALASKSLGKTYDAGFFRKVFLEEVSQRITWARGELKLERFTVQPEKVSVPDNARMLVRLKGSPGIGANVLLFDFYQDDHLVKRVRAMGFIEAYLPVVVVKRPVAARTVLTPEDLGFAKRPASRLPKDALFALEDALGKETRTSLRAGQVLRTSSLRIPPVIKRGKIVRIVARGKNFVVSALGEARQAGRPGEFIRVRNLSSKREVYAKVIDAQTVEVRF